MKAINLMAPLVMFISLALVPTYAQSGQEEPVLVTTNLVTVNVIVADSKGRYVKGLKAEQFSIWDENSKQQIAHFSVGMAPVSIGIVYEVHSSSRDQVTATLAALKQFVGTLAVRDNFFFTAYSADGSLTTEFIPSASQVMDHLTAVKPGGPSALYDVIYSAAGRLRQSRNLKRALLVISDGFDEHSKHSYNDLRNRLREFDAQIYTIGIVDPMRNQSAANRRWEFEDFTRQSGRRSFLNIQDAVGSAVLGEMARVSGGTAYTPETETEPELTGICKQIASELREQYTLGFYPHDSASTKWHRLKVRVDRAQGSGFSLSYRKGYQLATLKGS
jgi:Ca-activated chloride channel family protein